MTKRRSWLAVGLSAVLWVGCGAEELDSPDPDTVGPQSPVGETGGAPDEGPLVVVDLPPLSTPEPAPPALIGTVDNPTSIVADPNGVYWTDAAANFDKLSVVYEQAWGDEPMRKVAAHRGYPVSLALHGDYIYWADIQNGDVWATRRAGDGVLMNVATGQAAPYALAVNERFAVWTNIEDGTIRSLDFADGSRDVVAKAQGQPTSIGITTNMVVWADVRDGAIRATSPYGGGVMTLVDGVKLSEGMAVDDAYAYYGDHGRQALMRIALSGGEPQVIAPLEPDVGSIAVSGDTVVWTSARFGEIKETRIGSGTMRIIASQQADPASLAIANGRVHWVSRDDGGIWVAGLSE